MFVEHIWERYHAFYLVSFVARSQTCKEKNDSNNNRGWYKKHLFQSKYNFYCSSLSESNWTNVQLYNITATTWKGKQIINKLVSES